MTGTKPLQVHKALPIDAETLAQAVAATFRRRQTALPDEVPPGLSTAMAEDEQAQRRWRAFIESLELQPIDFGDVLNDIWALLEPVSVMAKARPA